MNYTYKTKGVCASQIDLSIENGIIKDVLFYQGCNGNLKGISALVIGMKASEAIDKLKGIRCGRKESSCPEQLAFALEEALKN